jgi:hypothetical protein
MIYACLLPYLHPTGCADAMRRSVDGTVTGKYYILVFPEPRKPVMMVMGIMTMTTTAKTRRSDSSVEKEAIHA